MTLQTAPSPSPRFLVEIEGLQAAEFTSVTLPESTIEAVEFRAGTDPAGMSHTIPGRRKLGHLILERRITANRDLCDWFERSAGGRADRKNGYIILLDEEKNTFVRWVFQSAWPVRYSLSRLEADSHAAMMETIELSLASFLRT